MSRSWKKDWPSLSFNELVEMYVHSCLVYMTGKNDVVGLTETFKGDEELVYFMLRELKDECLKFSGATPADWKDGKESND